MIKNFFDILINYNKTVNLTSIVDFNDFLVKHIEDSLAAKDFILENNIKKIIDIGSGAGFPGIPLAMQIKEAEFYLVESIKKKANFLEKVKKELALKNVTVVNKRIEDLEKENKADLVVARAVAPLSVLVEYGLPFIKVGGYCLFYKSNNIENELRQAEAKIDMLNGKIKGVKNYSLQLNKEKIERKLIIIEKMAECDKKYPRRKIK